MNLDFNKICRLCLRFCKDYIDLRHTSEATTVAEKIRFCYYIQIDSSDALPTKICCQCIQVLTFFYVTKKNAVASEQMLRNILYVKRESELKSVQCTTKIPDELVQVENMENMNKQLNAILLLASFKPMSETNDSSKGQKENNCVGNYHKVNDCSEITYKTKLSHCKHKKRKKHKILDVMKETQKLKMKNVRQSLSSKPKIGINKRNQINKILQTENVKLRELNQNQLRKSQWQMETVKDESTVSERPEEEKKTVKVIGTVIDENNILSPDIKRKRKTITDRYH